MSPPWLTTFVLLLITTIILLTVRLVSILPRFRGAPTPRARENSQTPTHLLIVLGSGGHTAEMLTMLTGMNTTTYHHRTYIISDGDPISATKAIAFEDTLREDAVMKSTSSDHARPSKTANDLARTHYGSFTLSTVPRARKIHQSVFTTPASCLRTFYAAWHVLCTAPDSAPPPDLILVNGPATSAIVVFASLALRFLGVSGHQDTRIIYVESFARVSKLSLSSRCVAWAVDRLLVQWEDLHGKAGGKAEYAGLLALASLPAK